MVLDESRKPLGKPVTTPLTVQNFATTSSNIAGTTTILGQSLKEIEAGELFLICIISTACCRNGTLKALIIDLNVFVVI
jgi:hypothetical protein